MTFIAAPSEAFSGSNLVDLFAAEVFQTKRFILPSGTYRITTAQSVSPVFTTTGNNTVLGGFVGGAEARTFLVAPAANFDGEQLTSLSGVVLSQSATVMGLRGGVAYRAMVLTPASTAFDVSLAWVVVDTVIEQAPTPVSPQIPVISGDIMIGPGGTYRFTNTTTSTVLEAPIFPPIAVSEYGLPGEEIIVEHLTFSSDGPDILLPVAAQIEVVAVGTLSRSVATVTLTPATWDTVGVTVTRQKVINDVSSTLTGTTFDVDPGDDYYVVETASKFGFVTSAPAQTATGTRPAATPTYVGGKTGAWPGTVSNQTVTLTGLTGGTDSTPQEGDIVLVSYGTGSTGSSAVSVVSGGYTNIAVLYSNQTSDTNQTVAYKFMGGTPDADIVLSSTNSTSHAGAVTIQVFRGVSIADPFSVTSQSTTGATGQPTAPAITPDDAGALVVVVAASGNTAGAVFTSGLSNFITTYSGDGRSVAVGAGTYNWISGTYTPTQWGGNTSAAGNSWAAVTLALKPAT